MQINNKYPTAGCIFQLFGFPGTMNIRLDEHVHFEVELRFSLGYGLMKQLILIMESTFLGPLHVHNNKKTLPPCKIADLENLAGLENTANATATNI